MKKHRVSIRPFETARATACCHALVLGIAWCWPALAAAEAPKPSAATSPAAPVARAPSEAEDEPDEPDVDRAEAYAAQAFDAYGRQDYAKAVALYGKAYEAAPTADILFNIARIYDASLLDRAQAIRFYQRYVADPEAEGERLQLATERIVRLKSEAAAELVPPRAPRVALVSAAAGAPGEPEAAGTEASVEPEPRPWTALRVGALVAGSVGLVGLGVGAGFGVAALSDAGTVRDYCDGNVCNSQRGVDAVHDASKNADIATASLALGGTLLAAGVALLWLEPSDSSEASHARLGVSPIASGSELGAALSGSW